MKTPQLFKTLHKTFIEPNGLSEDDHRRANIFNILVTGTIILSLLALVSSAVSKLTRGSSYDTVPLLAMAIITLFFAILLYSSKRGLYRLAAVIYIVFFFLIATYPISKWGILLPQGILTYCLIIVIAGVLLEARAAFIATIAATATLLIMERLSSTGSLHFDTA